MMAPYKFETAYDMNFFIVPKTELSNADLHYYKQQLIAVNNYDGEKRISMYDEDDNFFYFPRYYFKNREQVAKNIIDQTDHGAIINFECNIKLWDYQQKAINEFKEHLSKGRTGFFLGAAPGSGKTQMGIKMMEILGCTTLIIVPKKDLIEQWVERILKTTDLKKEDIGTCQAGKINWEGKKVVVGLIHTVVKYIDLESFRRYFGLLLFDECDSSVPPNTFAPAAIMFNSRYRIAMTASETRADGLHVIFQNHLVEVKIMCEKSNTMTPDVVFVNYDASSGKLPHSKDRIKSKGMLMTMLAKNEDRNNTIASYIYQAAIKEERPTAILSDRISQLRNIRRWLIEVYEVPEEMIGFYIGEQSKAENKRVADHCIIILASFGMLSRGTDITRLSCLVLATPRNDMRQISGRIERVCPNKKQPIIVDFIDPYNLCLSGKEQRLKFYTYRKMKIFTKNA
jgi:superfamily II DNA or RNA helicase